MYRCISVVVKYRPALVFWDFVVMIDLSLSSYRLLSGCLAIRIRLRTAGFLGTGDEMGRLCLHATWTVPGFRS